MFVLHGHRLCRDIAVVLIASVVNLDTSYLSYFYRETGNWRFTGSEIRRNTVSLVAEQRFRQFHDVFLVVKMVIPFFHDGMRKLQRWNHLISE